MIKIIKSADLTSQQLQKLLTKPAFDQVELSAGIKKGILAMFGEELTAKQVVEKILQAVRAEGDQAVYHYTKLIDQVDFSKSGMQVTDAEIATAYQRVKPNVLAAIKTAIANVEKFHQEQLPKSWLTYREHGSILGQNTTALDSVGIYVPGGTATYPSSVIMNAVPAKVAGVKEIIMVVPPAKDGSVDDYVLVTAAEIGVSKIFKVGGAQAVAALAFGTETVPKVDKITGPGNIFVTLAKKEVYGYCDIDMLAGPSEILIIADEQANPKYIASDMLGQAEHDSLASSILITTSLKTALATCAELEKQLPLLSRANIARTALEANGLIIVVEDLLQAADLANISAPEHLEVLTQAPFELLPYLKHAGAIFLGEYSPEPLGDYFAGPNHVLPTGGTAKFYSVLNTETFMKKTSIIAYSQKALQAVHQDIIAMAEAEGLTAHANAIKVRFNS